MTGFRRAGWFGIALIVAACGKPEDPLKEIERQLEIKCVQKGVEGGREEDGMMTTIYIDTYLVGTVTNKSDKNLADVVLALKNFRAEETNGVQFIQIGELPAGETAPIDEFMYEGAFVSSKAKYPHLWLVKATVAE